LDCNQTSSRIQLPKLGQAPKEDKISLLESLEENTTLHGLEEPSHLTMEDFSKLPLESPEQALRISFHGFSNSSTKSASGVQNRRLAGLAQEWAYASF